MRKLSNIFLIAITVSAIVNLRGLALMASGGWVSLGLSLLAALTFLVPSTYVCARLSVYCVGRGGIYQWVRHAFGQHVGFVAIWLEWINNVIEFPATMATIIGMLFLLFHHAQPLAWPFSLSMLALLWLALAYNLWPIVLSSWLNLIGALGTVFIAFLIIGLGFLWWLKTPITQTLAVPFQGGWLGQAAIFVSFIGAYSGMQITGFHNTDINSSRQFTTTLPIAALIIMMMMLGASTMMALLIPHDQLNVIAGVEQMVQIFFQHFHLPNLGVVVGVLVLLAMLASFSAWLIGPARGMQVALVDAGFDNVLTRLNHNGMPKGILLLQGVVTSMLVLCFTILPSIKTTFWLMVAMTSQFTALMYILVFAAGWKLVAQHWLGKSLCVLGMLSCVAGFCVGVFAPTELKLVSSHQYSFLVIIGDALVIFMGFLFAKHLRAKQKRIRI